MAACGTFLVLLECLWLSLRDDLVELSLARLVNVTGVGVESTWVVAKSLVLLVFRAASAFKADARLASALASVVSALLGRNPLRVGATAGLTCSAYADRGARELFEARLVDARLFRGDGGLWVKRILESAVRLVVQIAELYKRKADESGMSMSWSYQ